MSDAVSAVPRCEHFGICGGCQFQDLAYDAQIAQKSAELGALFEKHWEAPITVNPSPTIWNYRNKVDPAFARMRYEEPPPKDFVRETVLGFKKRGRWYDPLELNTCHIGPEGLDDLLAGIGEWYKGAGHRAWDNRVKDGVLRHLLVRDAKRTGERLVMLITTPELQEVPGFVEMVERVWPAHSVYQGLSTSSADVAFAEETRVLAGNAYITEQLDIPSEDGVRSLRFRISPFSFFQTNPYATEHLYARIRRWVNTVSPRMLYDLYGGVGSIALACSDLVEHVWSVEEIEVASIDGRINATENGAENVTFLTAKVETYLQHQLEADGFAEDAAIVVDPPRAGLHPKALKRLMHLAPKHLLYVSCNPKLLARELDVFAEGYRLASLEAFDLFPHTRHVEAVAILERKD